MPHSRGPTFILKTNLDAFLFNPPHYSVCCLLFIHVSVPLLLSSYLPISFTCSPTLLLSFLFLLPLVYLYDPLHLPVLLRLTPFLLLYIVSWLSVTHTSLLYFTIFPTCGSFIDCAIEQNHCQRFIIIKQEICSF